MTTGSLLKVSTNEPNHVLPQIGEEGFDPVAYEAKWGTRPLSMILIEFCGDVDPAFGGAADDRVVLPNGMVEGRCKLPRESAAVFTSVSEAHTVALKIPNRRPDSILGVAPKWR